MSRTTKYKFLYVAIIGGGIAAVLTLASALDLGAWGLLLVAAVLLIPGRIQGFYWREFFRGRRLLAEERYAEALPYFERFLVCIQKHRWLKCLIWLSWGIYTRDIEVMTRNNIGAAHLSLGNLERAEQCFESAVALDPEAPLPYFNMALLHGVRGNPERSQELLDKARALGFRATTPDQLVRASGELLARIEGRGITGSRPEHYT